MVITYASFLLAVLGETLVQALQQSSPSFCLCCNKGGSCYQQLHHPEPDLQCNNDIRNTTNTIFYRSKLLTEKCEGTSPRKLESKIVIGSKQSLATILFKLLLESGIRTQSPFCSNQKMMFLSPSQPQKYTLLIVHICYSRKK